MPYRWIVVVVLLLLAAGVLLPAVGALRRWEDRRRRMRDAIEAGQARESELASGCAVLGRALAGRGRGGGPGAGRYGRRR